MDEEIDTKMGQKGGITMPHSCVSFKIKLGNSLVTLVSI